MSVEKYALLRTFRGLFESKPYLHRKSNLGDLVASQLYEDLVTMNKSVKLVDVETARLANWFLLPSQSRRKEC